MSKFLKPGFYDGKALEQQYMNAVYSIHDLMCGCLDPINHLIEIRKRDKWLPTKDAATTTENGDQEDDDFPLTGGDLAQLFDTDKEEDAAR